MAPKHQNPRSGPRGHPVQPSGQLLSAAGASSSPRDGELALCERHRTLRAGGGQRRCSRFCLWTETGVALPLPSPGGVGGTLSAGAGARSGPGGQGGTGHRQSPRGLAGQLSCPDVIVVLVGGSGLGAGGPCEAGGSGEREALPCQCPTAPRDGAEWSGPRPPPRGPVGRRQESHQALCSLPSPSLGLPCLRGPRPQGPWKLGAPRPPQLPRVIRGFRLNASPSGELTLPSKPLSISVSSTPFPSLSLSNLFIFFFSPWAGGPNRARCAPLPSPLCPRSQDPRPCPWYLDTQTAPREGAGAAAAAGSSGTTPRRRCWSCQPRALQETPEPVTSPRGSRRTRPAGLGGLRTLLSQASSLMSEAMKAQRGEDTCPRSHSSCLRSWNRKPAPSLVRAPSLMGSPPGWPQDGRLDTQSPPGPAYLRRFPGSQPAPGVGAAPGGGPTGGSCCGGCCSSPPRTTCWTRCCSGGAAGGLGWGGLQRRVQGWQGDLEARASSHPHQEGRMARKDKGFGLDWARN